VQQKTLLERISVQENFCANKEIDHIAPAKTLNAPLNTVWGADSFDQELKLCSTIDEA